MYCHRHLGSAESAEDAASQVFTNAWQRGPRYGDPKIRSWLFTIAHNIVLNVFRSNRRERPLIELDETHDVAEDDLLLEEAAIKHEEGRRLIDALNELSDDQRQVVELRMAGLTGAEIAERLGRSHAAIKMLQYRAFTRLRDLLLDKPNDQNDESEGRDG